MAESESFQTSSLLTNRGGKLNERFETSKPKPRERMNNVVTNAPLGLEALRIILPTAAIVAAAVTFLLILYRKDGEIEVFELGVFYGAVVFLYSVYPILAFLTERLRFSRFADARLYSAQPLPSEMAGVSWYYFLYFVFFVTGYLLVRGRCKLGKMQFPRPKGQLLLVLTLLYLTTKSFFLFLRLYYDIRNPETYASSYLVYVSLPILVQQLVNRLGGIELTLDVLLMAFLVLNYRRYRHVILGWIALEFLGIYVYGIGARTSLFILLGSFLITYHFAVKHFSLRTAFAVGLIALALFTLGGILRESPFSYAGLPKNPLAYGSEFESLFANSYDLLQRKAAGEKAGLHSSFYVADILNLVPQQLLPVQKVDLAKWYVESYYPAFALSGGGLGFGAVAEAIVGLGWIDVAWRGAIIGVIFALIHRNFVRGEKSFWKYCSYLWIIVFSYESFRGTTFRLLPQFFYEFLTVLVAARAMVAILTLQQRSGPAIRSVSELGLPRRLLGRGGSN